MANKELHHILLGCGYKYTPARRLPEETLLHNRNHLKGYYIKDYPTKAGIFSIALILKNDPHIKLPTAYVLQIPDDCKGRLIPHIDHENFLCYVAQMEADWDPNNLDLLYRDVDTQIHLTLNNSIASVERGDPNDAELEGEFFAYWEPEEVLFLLAKPDKKAALFTHLVESIISDSNLYREYVTLIPSQDKDHEEILKWLIQRGFKAESLKGSAITTHYISVKPNRLAGIIWPPSNLRELLVWLAEVDHNARDRVVESLLSAKVKRHTLLLDIKHQDIIAIYIEINSHATGSRRHKKNGTRKTTMKHLVSVLSADTASFGFKRLSVIKADRDTLLSRNRQRPEIGNLSKKRIALVGCGTIGSYLGGLLLRSGAGCGSQHFHLYDNDRLGPHNFSRHALTAHDFGKNKAEALANSLLNSTHIAKNIKGFALQFPITSTALLTYDIIIDATGRPPVSKRLAAVVRVESEQQRPVLIHVFNDGNGRAAKVFVDTGDSCYSCMLTNPATHRNNIDLRFESVDQARERHISCGATYAPYDAAVSHIAAALAQEAALNTLEQEMPWTYNEHMLDGSRSQKPRIVKRQLNCSICNDRR